MRYTTYKMEALLTQHKVLTDLVKQLQSDYSKSPVGAIAAVVAIMNDSIASVYNEITATKRALEILASQNDELSAQNDALCADIDSLQEELNEKNKESMEIANMLSKVKL